MIDIRSKIGVDKIKDFLLFSNLGTMIKSFLEATKYTKVELANKSGVSINTIRSWTSPNKGHSEAEFRYIEPLLLAFPEMLDYSPVFRKENKESVVSDPSAEYAVQLPNSFPLENLKDYEIIIKISLVPKNK